MKKILFFCFVLFFGFAYANNDFLGTATPYVKEFPSLSKAPDGFKPFYINHLGRHGARFLSKDKKIDKVLNVLLDAKKDGYLTKNGEELVVKLEKFKDFEKTKFGLLSDVGKKMEFDIANRMLKNFPEVFSDKNREILANSTYVPRAIESMDEFLKVFNGYKIEKKINSKDDNLLRFFDTNSSYLKFKENADYQKEFKEFEKRDKNAYLEVCKNLFKKDFKMSKKDLRKFASGLYAIYINQDSAGLDVGLKEYFNEDSLKYFWQNKNSINYITKGPGLNNDISYKIAGILLQNFIKTSDEAIKNNKICANLRFAHAETIMPFVALIGVDFASKKAKNIFDISKIYDDSKVSPMGANIQWIFYKNDKNEILVKMLYNEKEINFPFDSDTKPYYKYSDIKKFYEQKLKNLAKN